MSNDQKQLSGSPEPSPLIKRQPPTEAEYQQLLADSARLAATIQIADAKAKVAKLTRILKKGKRRLSEDQRDAIEADLAAAQAFLDALPRDAAPSDEPDPLIIPS